MSYKDTFIQVADDCPVTSSVVPVAKGENKPAHLIQYELLTTQPYGFNHEELIFEVYVRHKQLPATKVAAHREELWAELFQKGHPCMRASTLTKKLGWGAHYNEEGKIAIYPMESADYQNFMQSAAIKKFMAMRSKRG